MLSIALRLSTLIAVAWTLSAEALAYSSIPEQKILWDGRANIGDFSLARPAGCPGGPDAQSLTGTSPEAVGASIIGWLKSCTVVSSCQRMATAPTGPCVDASIVESRGRYHCPAVKNIVVINPGPECRGAAAWSEAVTVVVDKHCDAIGRGVVYDRATRDCRCAADTVWVPERAMCVGIVYRDLVQAPKDCRADVRVGNPVAPLRGVKSEQIALGASIAGASLVFSFDSSLRAPGAPQGPDAPKALGPAALSELWSSNFHKSVSTAASSTLSGWLHGARVSRGNGEVVSFRAAPSGTLVAEGNIDDRLDFVQAWNFRYFDKTVSSIETFTRDGRLERIDFATGGWISLHYSDAGTPPSIAPSSGHLIKVQDHHGRSIGLEYALVAGDPLPGARISRVVDAAGRVIPIAYDTGRLSRITWPDMHMRRFVYDSAAHPWALTGVIDELGIRTATFGYDAAGRAVSTERAGGVNRFSVTYGMPPSVEQSDMFFDDHLGPRVLRERRWRSPSGVYVMSPLRSGHALSATSVLGTPRLAGQSQPAGSGCAASASAQAYDARGNLVWHDDFNGTRTCSAFASARNTEITRVEGLTGGAVCTSVTAPGAPLPAGSRKISTEWHPEWNFKTRTAEPGRIVTTVYNARPDPFSGHSIAQCVQGDPVLPDGSRLALPCREVEQATTDADGSKAFAASLHAGVPARERRWTYNQFGQVLTETDALGRTTTFHYHAETAFAGTGPGATGYRRGDLMQVTNAAGHVTRFPLYNKSGQSLQIVDPNNVAAHYTYDARGRMTSASKAGQTTVYDWWPTGLLRQITAADGSWVQYEHDGAHRLVRISDNLGNALRYGLDAAGNRVSEQVNDPSGALRRQVTRSTDALGRVQQVIGRE